jgi:hypothetical protein
VQRRLRFTHEAETQLRAISMDSSAKGLHRQLLKTLGLLELNTRHPGLHSDEYQSLTGLNGERIWEAYAQNDTPGAFRVFFHYGPDEGTGKRRIAVLTIVAITAHP